MLIISRPNRQILPVRSCRVNRNVIGHSNELILVLHRYEPCSVNADDNQIRILHVICFHCCLHFLIIRNLISLLNFLLFSTQYMIGMKDDQI